MVRRFLRRKITYLYLSYVLKRSRPWECWDLSGDIWELMDCITERTVKAMNSPLARFLEKILEVI